MLVDTTTPGDPEHPVPVSEAEHREAVRTAVMIAISGFCLPWLIGLAVKLSLELIGRPTYPISSFLTPTTVLTLLTATVVRWCWPFLLLAAWLWSRLSSSLASRSDFRERVFLAKIMHAAGIIGGIVIFVPVFRRWDPIDAFAPIGIFLGLAMLVGYVIGRLVLYVRPQV